MLSWLVERRLRTAAACGCPSPSTWKESPTEGLVTHCLKHRLGQKAGGNCAHVTIAPHLTEDVAVEVRSLEGNASNHEGLHWAKQGSLLRVQTQGRAGRATLSQANTYGHQPKQPRGWDQCGSGKGDKPGAAQSHGAGAGGGRTNESVCHHLLPCPVFCVLVEGTALPKKMGTVSLPPQERLAGLQ